MADRGAVVLYLVRCGHCGFVGDATAGECVRCGYDGVDPPSEGLNLIPLTALHEADAAHVVRWERGPTEAAIRHAHRDCAAAGFDVTQALIVRIGRALYEADRPVPRVAKIDGGKKR